MINLTQDKIDILIKISKNSKYFNKLSSTYELRKKVFFEDSKWIDLYSISKFSVMDCMNKLLELSKESTNINGNLYDYDYYRINGFIGDCDSQSLVLEYLLRKEIIEQDFKALKNRINFLSR